MFRLRGFGGGLLLGFGLVGLVLGLLYLFPKYIQPLVSSEAIYETTNFEIRYLKSSVVAKELDVLGTRLEEELAYALASLQADRTRLPQHIAVLISDNADALLQAIVDYANPFRGGIPIQAVGLVRDQSFRRPILELVLGHTWRFPTSLMIRTGLILTLSQPPFEAQVAALSDNVAFTIEELLQWEKRGNFPKPTYLPDERSDLLPNISSEEDFTLADAALVSYFPSPYIARAQVTTLVRFLLTEMGGVQRIKQLWTLEPFDQAVRMVYDLTLDELEVHWKAWVAKQGQRAEEYSYYRGEYLLGVGAREEAESFLERALAGPMGQSAALALGQLKFEQGRWTEAQKLLKHDDSMKDSTVDSSAICTMVSLGQWSGSLIKNGFVGRASEAFHEAAPAVSELPSEWQRRLECFMRWDTLEGEDFLLHYAPELEESARGILPKAEGALVAVLTKLGIARAQLPKTLVIFYGSKTTWPLYEGLHELRSVLSLSPGEAVGYKIALIALSHWQKHQTYSQLLRRGLAYYLDQSGRDYLQEAEKLSMTTEWVPFASLDFDAYPFESVRVGVAAMVGYLLESRGIRKLRELWRQTAPLGDDRSLDGALKHVYKLSREELERELIDLWTGKLN